MIIADVHFWRQLQSAEPEAAFANGTTGTAPRCRPRPKPIKVSGHDAHSASKLGRTDSAALKVCLSVFRRAVSRARSARLRPPIRMLSAMNWAGMSMPVDSEKSDGMRPLLEL